ncbi:AraC-type DNA-binding protein [Paenibacillus sp. UNC496MF]|uniref:helix-turn-helix domain-containing protein n=1 Tax=Paenibacillus sp. UNC496MF TaxID=1502753 RepID=UPI0008F152E0|nr:helix-turn-helix domain-containing protein [Paenibacillus sp. UNC496MF]SFJ41284.1 AraC-type DNA-binding protein [Paenibacillus sp. UNC496MF]
MSPADAVQRAIDYIEAHLDEELDLSRLAEEAYASVAGLYRLFYALTGHPVKDYVRKRRISVAAERLRFGKPSAEELARESGFETYPAFAKAFKKIVGLTPSAYRTAGLHFSFEPVRLRERFAYAEDGERSDRFPGVKVIRFAPDAMHGFLHDADREAGLEDEAYRIAAERLSAGSAASPEGQGGKWRLFGSSVDLPDADGRPRYGYKMLVPDATDAALAGCGFAAEPFAGGLYAVSRIASASPGAVQDGWDRLVSDWLPGSAFELDGRPCIEEFVAHRGKLARMNLFLPVRRKLRAAEPIEVVRLPERPAFAFRGSGARAQRDAERRFLDWHERARAEEGAHSIFAANGFGEYYMSYRYGEPEPDAYWWENGLLVQDGAESRPLAGAAPRRLARGLYACCVTPPHGLLAGVLEKLYRWAAASGRFALDDGRQWFAAYRVPPGGDAERNAVVRVYLPIVPTRTEERDGP